MASVNTKRTCPYCGDRLELGRLPVVATNVTYKVNLDDDFDQEDDGTKRMYPVSGCDVHAWLGDLPVVAMPAILPDAGPAHLVKRVLMLSLPPVDQVADPADLPARLCTTCLSPLPMDIDDREALIVAVVGTGRAGKTHFLASMLREASRLHGLERFGCVEFAPDERTSGRYQQDYYLPMFVRRRRLEGTVARDDIVKRPLVYRVTFGDQEPFLLLFHDVAGETLSDRESRAKQATFIRRAQGIILLIDPVSLEPPGEGEWPPSRVQDDAHPYDNQADLLNACVNELPEHRRWDTPFAITLSKGDLIARYLESGGEDDHSTAEERVRRLLAACGAKDLLATADRLGPETVSFHAVAAIGAPPDDDGRLPYVRPVGCLEPLLAVLHGLSRPTVLG